MEKKIKEFYEEDIYDQAKHMIEKYPKKEFILGPAIEAHKRGEYALSILAFFVIADGICRDNTGREIFQGYPEKRISAWAKEKFHEIDNAKDKWPLEFFRIINLMMFEQIIEQLPVMYNANKRIKNDYSGLNRNTFLHGLANKEDATKENSLKAFSLLSYIASFLNEKRLNFITSIQDK